MPERSGYSIGEPCWVDLGTPDLDAAIRFYGEVLGWSVDKGPEEYGSYSMASVDGKLVAGIMPLQEGSQQPPAWNVYLTTDSADLTAEKAVKGGARMAMEPMDVMDQGRMFYAFDPTGAGFGIWQPGQHKGSQLVAEPGAPGWFELMTRDGKAADEFYASLFAYEADPVEGAGGMDYAVYKLVGREMAGRMVMGSDMPVEVPPHWVVYFGVNDTDAAVSKVRELGGQVLAEPMDSPYGRLAAVTDLWGAQFNVLQVQRG